MKNNWEMKKLGEVCEITAGGDRPKIFSKEKTQINNVPVYSNGIDNDGLYGYTDKARYFKKSVTVSARGTIGFVALRKEPYVPIVRLISVVPDDDIIDVNFLYYCLRNSSITGTGTTQQQLIVPDFKNLDFLLPPLPTQRAIARVLSALDDKIENNIKINKTLEHIAQAIYKAWFVDFEPFGGVRPEGWREQSLGDYCFVKSGFAFKSSWWQQDGVRVIKIKNITDNGFDFSDCSFVSDDKVSCAKEFVANAGDLLIAMTGATIGKFAIIPQHSGTLLVNQRVGKFFLGEKPFEKLPFLWCLLKQKTIINEIINRGQGSAQANISPTDIMTVSVIIPTDDVLNDFNLLLRSSFETMAINNYENQKLTTLRNALLPRLMSGEIDVSGGGK